MNDAELKTILSERLHLIEERIATACQKSHRDRSAVRLIAVTKTVSPQVARCICELGVTDLGENRPQELKKKFDALRDLSPRWHMIGHLQRNKVEQTLACSNIIHAVDSLRLLESIGKEAQKKNLRPEILLQINASREEQKHGFDYDEALLLEKELLKYPVAVVGLMGMAAISDEPEETRPVFKELREFRDRLQREWKQLGQSMAQLSMGMSADFEIAIEEGSTMIRLGTTLFEGLSEPETV